MKVVTTRTLTVNVRYNTNSQILTGQKNGLVITLPTLPAAFGLNTLVIAPPTINDFKNFADNKAVTQNELLAAMKQIVLKSIQAGNQ